MLRARSLSTTMSPSSCFSIFWAVVSGVEPTLEEVGRAATDGASAAAAVAASGEASAGGRAPIAAAGDDAPDSLTVGMAGLLARPPPSMDSGSSPDAATSEVRFTDMASTLLREEKEKGESSRVNTCPTEAEERIRMRAASRHSSSRRHRHTPHGASSSTTGVALSEAFGEKRDDRHEEIDPGAGRSDRPCASDR